MNGNSFNRSPGVSTLRAAALEADAGLEYEAELARRARSGDRQALVELVEWARLKMYPVAYAALRHHDDAQDAVGSALLQLCLHLNNLRRPDRLRGWMYSIVRNEARRLLRGRVPEIPDQEIEEQEAPAPAFPEWLVRIDVERALYRLPFDEARAVALFYLKGASIREISRYLERPEGTIKRWLHLGRRKLARELEVYAPMTPAVRRRVRRVLIHAVGQYPTRVATNAVTGRVYVANAAGLITIIDGATQKVEATVQAGRGAMALAVDPGTNRIFVTHLPEDPDSTAGALTIIDAASGERVATMAVGNSPRAISVNLQTGKAYIVSSGENAVYVVNGKDARLAAVVPVGSEPVALAVNPNSNRIYVVNWGSCTLSVIDGASDEVCSTIEVGAFPLDAAVDPRRNRVYVANSQDDTITIIDGAREEILRTVPVGRTPVGVAVNPQNGEIYVSHSPWEGEPGALLVLDPHTGRATGRSPVGTGRCSIAVGPGENNLYLARGDDSTVSVIAVG